MLYGTKPIMERTFPPEPPPTERELVAGIAPKLRSLLPQGWSVEAEDWIETDGERQPRGAVLITAPDGRAARVPIEARSLISPKDALGIAGRLSSRAPSAKGRLAVARYLSPSARDALAAAGLSYMDWTGNVSIALTDPGLAVVAPGADRDPFRTPERPTNSLKGEPAAKVVRALVDRRPPWRMRELAQAAQTSLGSTARTVDFLDREALLTRERGTVVGVDWPALLGRWAQEYDFATRRRVVSALASRGLEAVEASLQDSAADYVVSGSLAARRIAPYADARLGLVYATDIDQLSDQLRLRATPTRPNVLLIEPRDDLPFARSRVEDGVRWAAPSQVYADLMSGPGRSTEEASALLEWMHANEAAWRE